MQICNVGLYALAVHFWCFTLYRRIQKDAFRMAPQKCCWCHAQPLKHH